MTDVAVQLLAGTTAGAASVLVDYPLDTLKTRMQVVGGRRNAHPHTHVTQPQLWPSHPRWRVPFAPAPSRYPVYGSCSPSSSLSSEAAMASSRAPCPRAGGYVACLRDTWRADGAVGFYRGMSVPLLAQGAENAIIFSVFSATVSRLEPFFAARRTARERRRRGGVRADSTAPPPPAPTPSPVQRAELWCAAAAAGGTVSLILTPVEFVKGNMQAGACRGEGRRHCVRHFCHSVYRERGVGGFYTGFTGTWLRAVPGNIAYFLTYKQLLHNLGEGSRSSSISSTSGQGGEREGAKEPQHPPAAWQCVLAGGVSGAVYWSVMYPCDVVKTRMQICAGTSCAAGRRGGSSRAVAYRPSCSFGEALQDVYRCGGLRALYRGWGVTVARAFLSSAVVFTVYEHVQRSLVVPTWSTREATFTAKSAGVVVVKTNTKSSVAHGELAPLPLPLPPPTAAAWMHEACEDEAASAVDDSLFW